MRENDQYEYMPLCGNQGGSSRPETFQNIDDINFGVATSAEMTKPWYHFSGQDDTIEQRRLHA